MTVPFHEKPNDGTRRTSPNAIELPLRTTTRPIGDETLLWEFDKKGDRAVCRITVLRDGRPTDSIEFNADHLGELKSLRKTLQDCWRANILRGDWPLTFFGALRRQ